LRMRHPEVALDVLLCGRALLLPDHRHGFAVQEPQTRDDGRVVAELPIAVELLEVREDSVDDIERVRPLRVPRELHRLPRGPAPQLREIAQYSLEWLRAVAIRRCAAGNSVQHAHRFASRVAR